MCDQPRVATREIYQLGDLDGYLLGRCFGLGQFAQGNGQDAVFKQRPDPHPH